MRSEPAAQQPEMELITCPEAFLGRTSGLLHNQVHIAGMRAHLLHQCVQA